MASVPYPLRHLLGEDPAAVTAEALSKLIGEPESQHADWKRRLDLNDKTKVDLATDIAAYANANGGLMVVGLDEGDGSIATEFVDVDLSGKSDLVDQLHSTIRSRVQPPAPYSIHTVTGPGGTTIVLIAIDPSEAAPHSVSNGSWARYPVRSGTGKRYLSEPEVADWYGRRLRRIADQDARTDDLRAAAIPEWGANEHAAWLTVTVVPSRPGTERLGPGDLERYRSLLATRSLRTMPFDVPQPWNVRIGHRAVLAADHPDGDAPNQRALLAVDGSGYAAYRWGGNRQGIIEHQLVYLCHELFWLLSTLSAHAAERGVSGTATVTAEVMSRSSSTIAMATGLPTGRPAVLDPAPTHRGPSPVSTHTVDLGAVAATTSGLLAATELLGADVASSFGYPALPGIAADGAVRPAGLSQTRDQSQVIGDWAVRHGVPVAE